MRKTVLDPVWSLVIASALGVIGGLIPYKQLVSHLADTSEEEFIARRERAFSRFLVRYFIAEAVPILFLGYGMWILLEGGISSDEMDVFPFLVTVILIALFGALSVYLATSQFLQDPQVSDEMRNSLKSARAIGFNLVNMIPEVSIVLLIMVMIGWM